MGRPVRGSRLSSFYTVDPNPSLSSLDSAFQLQEYISLLVRLDPHDVQRIVALPGKKDMVEQQQSPPSDEDRPIVDEACWIYEQLRRLAQDLTHPLITTLQQECTRQTCPEMKAGEWLYLCVAHGNSGGMEHCCAIDYIVHTLDSATALLNSPRAFPSRISIPTISHRHFPSLARRLGRIFAHAYHHHRAAFESAEAEGALYARFLALARRFDLVPAEFLVIPPRPSDTETEDADPQRVTLLTREHEGGFTGSPRIGGRSRTDTMYLSGDLPGTMESRSPQRMPGPLSGMLLTEHINDPTVLDSAGREVAEKSKVYVRDFALPPEINKKQVPEQTPSVEKSPSEEASEQDEEPGKEPGTQDQGPVAQGQGAGEQGEEPGAQDKGKADEENAEGGESAEVQETSAEYKDEGEASQEKDYQEIPAETALQPEPEAETREPAPEETPMSGAAPKPPDNLASVGPPTSEPEIDPEGVVNLIAPIAEPVQDGSQSDPEDEDASQRNEDTGTVADGTEGSRTDESDASTQGELEIADESTNKEEGQSDN